MAIHQCHSLNIAHRDIKPEKILLENGLRYGAGTKISDFSNAVKLDGQQKCEGIVGTLPYIAPEVLFQMPYDYSCDIWSFGCMVYGLLTGDHPLLTQPSTDLHEMR